MQGVCSLQGLNYFNLFFTPKNLDCDSDFGVSGVENVCFSLWQSTVFHDKTSNTILDNLKCIDLFLEKQP